MKSLGLIKKALVGSIATLCIASIAYGEELKVCETKQDKMSGCIEMIEGEESYTNTPYKNGKLNGVVVEHDENCQPIYVMKTPYVNDKKEGEAKFLIGDNLVATIKYSNGKFVSAKCTNGKTLSQGAVESINMEYTGCENVCE
ncbi:hypothetical protein XJ32_10020 [Helicobacter bilis]|uniref:Uncharacterized protein n=1 Tax=Helicobacter bilis TaxID=37372 RepID=A0A1Q2LK49_9HELI|nr:hypothetical protein [Helicobacter bilis]AQQ60372.1 hypothetical protein XJ32_10020 [Helicobacter bilis]